MRQTVNPQTARPSSSSSFAASFSASISFGQPKHGLVAPIPPTRVNSLASLPPQSGSISPAASGLPLHNQQSIQQESITQSDNGLTSSNNQGPKPTWQELEHERQTAKIPSSRTPSPMKLAKAGSRSSTSPAKIDSEATKALQESITRALKRHTSEEDAMGNGARKSKRQRPQRHKVSPSPSSIRGLYMTLSDGCYL
jgi:hypothetical protein